MSEYFLQMKNICKAFPGIKALDGACLNVRPGTVHALMGENGAGKSTLMKCMFGIYTMDSGEMLVDGQRVAVKNPLDALQKGFSMVHQELQPIPERSIAENIYCGRYPMKKFGIFQYVDEKKMNQEAVQWLKAVHLDIDPETKLGELSISQMQLVEIAKAISTNAKIVIMDEPTSSLTDNEVEDLFRVINELRSKGVAIIYISHKMEEILRISDEVTIMRDGCYIGTWNAKELTTDIIIAKMVGRELNNIYPPKKHTPGEVIFEVKNVTSILPNSFKDISFDLRAGEILGFGGLVGAQRTELMEAIFGMRNIASGQITLHGKQLNIKRPKDAIQNKIGLITEDRRQTGIFGILSVEDNVSIASLDQFIKYGIVLDQGKIDDLVKQNIDKLNIKTPSGKTLIKSLSGGNQQKAIISRWLANSPDILIMDEPTRGIDVGAKYEIYQIMFTLAEAGKSIIMISSDMAELMGVSDRIAVMCNGRLSGELSGEDVTQEKIMQLATNF